MCVERNNLLWAQFHILFWMDQIQITVQMGIYILSPTFDTLHKRNLFPAGPMIDNQYNHDFNREE